ncbi:MAG: carboxypeptidase-like regulatory domain-containing protein [Candidatus Acidiferrales bacterium]
MDAATIRREFSSACALSAFLAIGLLCAGPCRAQSNNSDKPAAQSQPAPKDDKPNAKDDKSATPRTTKLKINVTNSEDKPVGNASVYVRFNESGGFLRHDKLAELSFKTNEDGSVKVPAIPAGKILIQVIAKGLHTFGKWYDIEDDTATIDIKLDPPPHWY